MSHTSSSLVDEMLERTGVNVMRCYQCGKCSAGCPMSSEMTTRPQAIMHLVQRNMLDRLLADDSIWLCLSCETCSARCPMSADPARVIDTLREIAYERDPSLGPHTIGTFHKTFLSQVESSGRMSEVGLAMQYNFRSGHPLQDAASVPQLMSRGKFRVNSPSIKDAGEVRRIFRNVENAQKKVGGSE